ncbi:hypothetical protein SELMODRAFT_445701, partial [Selaginella moellendorffii]
MAKKKKSLGEDEKTWVWNCVIRGYGMLGPVKCAREAFLQCPAKNFLSWKLLADAYAQKGHYGKVLEIEDKIPAVMIRLVRTLRVLVRAQNTNIEELLDVTDLQVREIAKQAIECLCLRMIAVQGVYRLACQAAMQRQSQDEIQKLSCIGVHQNLACTASGMEHVATVSPELASETDTAAVLCAQKPLDHKLQQACNSIYEGKALFGGIDNRQDYADNEKSVWPLPEAFLRHSWTLSNGDQVAVSTISGGPIAAPVSVVLENLETSSNASGISSLKDAIAKVKVDNSPKDIKKALAAALDFFNSSSNLNCSNFNFTDLNPLFTELNDKGVVVFVYRIGFFTSNDATFQKMQAYVDAAELGNATSSVGLECNHYQLWFYWEADSHLPAKRFFDTDHRVHVLWRLCCCQHQFFEDFIGSSGICVGAAVLVLAAAAVVFYSSIAEYWKAELLE